MKFSLSLEFDTDVPASLRASGRTVAVANTIGWEEEYWMYVSGPMSSVVRLFTC
ncbi:hypothetical protein GGQ71_000727 [Rhizobium taibaishanense]|uniref:Uncharacterized protein n=1 Tax=Allorhizobium taibaishanense TaxID=887144 RepID=A0A7W6HJW1_9HYPH|nr:hypothetical protein [Allorhizobium taibaishanense]